MLFITALSEILNREDVDRPIVIVVNSESGESNTKLTSDDCSVINSDKILSTVTDNEYWSE